MQCAGFLRVPESKNPLDNTGVHPESYEAAKAVLCECGYSESDIKAGGVEGIVEKAESIGISALAEKLGVGEPTLRDILKELSRPGRDPRDELPPPMLKQEIMSMEDLTEGMEMTGTVRNVIDFGVLLTSEYIRTDLCIYLSFPTDLSSILLTSLRSVI